MTKRKRKRSKNQKRLPDKPKEKTPERRRLNKKHYLSAASILVVISLSITGYSYWSDYQKTRERERLEAIKHQPVTLTEPISSFIEHNRNKKEIESILDLSVFDAYVKICQEVDPSITQEVADKFMDDTINEMMKLYRIGFTNAKDREKKLNILMSYFFTYLKMSYDGDITNAKQFLLSSLMEKKGNCVSMPILVVSMGERLNLPISLTMLNSHVFARSHDGLKTINIECTYGNMERIGVGDSETGPVPDKNYLRDFPTEQGLIDSGAYMRTLNKKEVLGMLYYARASYYRETRGNRARYPHQYLRDLANCLYLYPKNAQVARSLSKLMAGRGKIELAKAFRDHAEKLGANVSKENKAIANSEAALAFQDVQRMPPLRGSIHDDPSIPNPLNPSRRGYSPEDAIGISRRRGRKNGGMGGPHVPGMPKIPTPQIPNR